MFGGVSVVDILMGDGKGCGCDLRVEHIHSLSGMSVDAARRSCLVAHL